MVAIVEVLVAVMLLLLVVVTLSNYNHNDIKREHNLKSVMCGLEVLKTVTDILDISGICLIRHLSNNLKFCLWTSYINSP